MPEKKRSNIMFLKCYLKILLMRMQILLCTKELKIKYFVIYHTHNNVKKDYFYGNDKTIEDLLGEFESSVDDIFRKVLVNNENDMNNFNIDELNTLSFYCCSVITDARNDGKNT